MKRFNLKDFELSQAYLFYWDKIEKANFFLEKIIETASLDIESRLVQELLSDPVSDGGQWDMLFNIVSKYGLVPQALYPDSFSAKASAKMDWLVTVKLREQALALREIVQSSSRNSETLSAAKEKFVKEIHSIVTIMLGPPPNPEEKFSWDFYDADGRYRTVSFTPKEFAGTLSTKHGVQACGANVAQFFSLVNDPRNEYERLLTVDKLGNVVGGRPITYVNVAIEVRIPSIQKVRLFCY